MSHSSVLNEMMVLFDTEAKPMYNENGHLKVNYIKNFDELEQTLDEHPNKQLHLFVSSKIAFTDLLSKLHDKKQVKEIHIYGTIDTKLRVQYPKIHYTFQKANLNYYLHAVQMDNLATIGESLKESNKGLAEHYFRLVSQTSEDLGQTELMNSNQNDGNNEH
ncbi:unnamed protein product [Didymodactylos carnosus]|uniref:Uncharacterized protein n=1 Tax=Didymodactylos carnosus TaxID=1234261 RepID=A0A8S2DEU7_9BILA|nr:unnamed protein product [Didymodactylos carnosus]CAF3669277.1 unnamed protein product [Didymodactylos carnosus]